MPDITRYTAEERRRLREQALRNSKQNKTTGRKTIPAPVVTSPVVANKRIYTSPVKQSAPGMPPAVRSTPDIYRREIDKKFISDMMNNSSNRISNFTTSLPGETSGLVSDGNVNVPYNRAALSSERNQLAANLSTITRMQAQYAETDDQEMKDLLANAYGLQMDLNDLLNSHGEYIDQFDTPQQQAAFEYDQEIKNTPDVIPFDQWRETFEGFENDKRTSDPTTAWQYDQQLNTLIDYAMAQPSLREQVMEYLRTESDAYDDASRAANAAEREIEGMWVSPRESLDEAAMNIHSQMENYYSLADEEERARLAAEEAAPDLSRAENQLYYNELNDQYGFSEIEERNAKLENGGVHEKAYEAFKSAAAVDFGRADGNGQQSVLYYADPVEVATYLSLIPPEERAKGNYVNTSPFSNKGWEAAEAYLTYIRDRLEQRAVTEASDKMRQYYDFAASDNGWEKLGKGIAGTAASVAGGILQGVHAADIYGQAFQRALTGSKEPIHFYSTAMPTEYASVPREAITSELDGLGDINSLASKVFGKDVDIKGWGKLGLDSVYNAAVDSLTSLANVGLFGRSGMGAAMGLQAAAPAMNEAHEAGANDWQSVLYGTGIGAAEGIGEQVGFERFLQLGQKHGLFNSTKGKLLLGLVLQPFNEGVGEAATEQIGQLVDRYVLDENSDYQRRIQTYISQGIAPEEAEARVDQEMGEQIVDSMLQGILGGAMTSGGYYAADAVNKAVTGKKSTRAPVETASKPPVEGTSEATKAKAEARLAAMKTTEGEASLVDNAPVTVAGITKTGADATVTVTDESGADRQVKLEEVTVGKGTQGEVYAYAADMATPELANTFRMVYRPDQDISQVANGMEYVYEMAEGGAPETFLRKTSLTSALNDDQFKHAYDLGKKRRVETIKAADEKATARLQSVLGNRWKGGTLSMGDVVEASLTEKQREDVELVRVLAGISGYKVELFQSTANEAGRFTKENGRFNPATNTIYLDINAGRDYVGDSMAKTALLRTMSHEVTHAIKANSPAIYGRLQEAVLEALSTQGIDIDERISAVMTRDSSVKSRADALEEIVSDACETMLGDSDVAQRFKEAHPEEARSLGEKILEFLKNLRDAIKKAFAGEAGAKSVEAKALLKDMDAFQKIAEIWTEGALQTSEVVGRENNERTGDKTGDVKHSPRNYDVEVTDEQIAENMRTVAGMRSVMTLKGDEVAFGDGSLKRQILAFFESVGGKVYNKILGDVELNGRSFRDDMSHGMYPLKATAFYAVPAVLEHGEIIDYSPNWQNRGYRTYLFAAPIQVTDGVDKGDYWMGVVVKADANMQNLYTHDVVLINKKGSDTLKTGAAANIAGVSGGTKPSVQSILEQLNNVNPEIKNSTRDPFEVSDREILANALEDATKNADEKAWLEAYKKDLAELNATQAILDENRSIISSLEYRKYQKKETLTKEETERLEKARVRVKALVKRLAERDSALLKVEAAPQIKAVLERQREKYEERKKNAVAHVRQTQENAAFRKRIARKVKRLDELVRKPTDQKHVPDELRGSIIQLVKVFAEDTGVFQKSILRDVRDQYELLAKGESGAAGLYDEDTKERLEDLEKLMDGKRLSELSREALREVDLLIDHMSFLIDNANTIFVNGRRETIDGIASEIVDQTLSKGAMMTNKLKNSALWKLISSGQITPVYFFKHIGGGFQRLGESILAGESKFGVNALKARDKIQGLMNQYHYHEWSNKKGDELTLKTEAGAELKLSREQALALYATYKRETSNELQNASHLRTGGVILPKDSKKLDWFKKSADVRNGAPITAADMSKVQNWLTKEQMDYADAMVDYLSKDLSRMGNETSVAMHGYSKFGEGYYYPYKTSANFRRTNLETAEQALIKNMGFTKSVVRKATTPVELYDFTTTVAEHVNNMLLYTSFAEAQDVFMRVYDHKVDENHTVKSMLETSFGSNTKNYIEQFMKDIYGGVTSDKREGLPNKLLSAFKRNAVMGSLSVAIQQPTSFARAFALVDPKHFAVPGIKGGFDEAMKYAGTAVIKDMGRFDTTGGRSVAEWLAEDSYQGAGEKAKAYFTDAEYRADINGFLPEVLDKVTWSGIWKAIKHEQAQKTGLDIESEALKEIAGRRFDEVIRRTQVYDSVMAKSEIMRSKSFGLKMVTAFMAEPTVTYNMGVDAVIEAKKGNKKVAARLLSSLVVASVLNNLAKSLITAARDDNEDEPIVEKYLRAVFGGLLNDVNPVNYVPFLKDIWSIYQGYDVARTDMNIVTDLLTAATEEVKLAASGNATFWDYAKPAAAVFSMLTAVPIKNWWRDTEGIVETISGKRGKFEAREGSIKRIAKESGKEFLSGVFYDFWSDSKKNNARKLLGAAISGDERAIDELNEHMQTFNGMDESQIETSLTNALKGRFEDGGVTEKDALRIMMDYAGYTKHDAEAKIAKWKYDVDTDNEFSDMQDDFIEGKITESDAISAMVEYGGKTEREAKAAVEKWKYQVDTGDKFSDVEDMFVRGEMTKAEAEAALTEYGGYRKSEAADKVQQWQYEIDTGRKYSEMKDDYLDGTIRTNKEAADFRVKYGGQDPDSAEATVMQWQYDKDTGRVYSEMRYDFADGIISRSQAEGYLQKYGLKEPDEAYWAVEGWKYESDGESEWSGKFTHLHDAMADNDTANIDKAITQVYENSAYKDEDAAASAVVSAITSQYKPLYIAASEAERERLETLLLYAYRRAYELADKPWYGDYRRLKTIRKWLETDD